MTTTNTEPPTASIMLSIPVDPMLRPVLDGLARVEPEATRMENIKKLTLMTVPLIGHAGYAPLAVPAYMAALAAGPAPCAICGAATDPADHSTMLVVLGGYDAVEYAAEEIDRARVVACGGCTKRLGRAVWDDLMAASLEASRAADPGVSLITPQPTAATRAERRRKQKAQAKRAKRPGGIIVDDLLARAGVPTRSIMRADLVDARDVGGIAQMRLLPKDCLRCGRDAGASTRLVVLTGIDLVRMAPDGDPTGYRVCAKCAPHLLTEDQITAALRSHKTARHYDFRQMA